MISNGEAGGFHLYCNSLNSPPLNALWPQNETIYGRKSPSIIIVVWECMQKSQEVSCEIHYCHKNSSVLFVELTKCRNLMRQITYAKL